VTVLLLVLLLFAVAAYATWQAVRYQRLFRELERARREQADEARLTQAIVQALEAEPRAPAQAYSAPPLPANPPTWMVEESGWTEKRN